VTRLVAEARHAREKRAREQFAQITLECAILGETEEELAMTSLALSSLVVSLVLSQGAPAKPDFSGIWSKDRSRSQSEEAITLEIKQSASEVRISTTRGRGQPAETTFPILASPPASTGGIDPERPRAYWDGAKLVTENAGNVSGQTVSVKETRSFNAAGEMVIDTLVIVQHGYSLTGGKNYGSGTDIYVKAKRP